MVRLTDVLRFIHSEESLRGFLALKGGTAINLTLFDLPRLSVDIDLDMTRNLSIGAVDIERERIAGMLTRYMLANGYKESGKSRRHRILCTRMRQAMRTVLSWK
jgi:predicted nucleotidyltransferase component of viral defense system